MVSLLIDKCVPEDDGEYTLTAINMAGEDTNTARVFVVGKAKIKLGGCHSHCYLYNMHECKNDVKRVLCSWLGVF